MKQGVSLEKFFTDIAREFTTGLTIVSVRPAVRREVKVLVIGLHFNTSDDCVREYLECFGAKVKGEPIYGVHREGPWKGQYNGERRYLADFSDQILPMGTYHLVDGAKVRVVYPGNTRTCARCHQDPLLCPGGGMAKECAEKGGRRVPLSQHMGSLWDRVGFYGSGDSGGVQKEED